MVAPLVTIVIATYRSRRDHLATAISSALQQTCRNIEVIVSDDSPDDTLREFVAGFDDPRLVYRRNVPPLGVARNHWLAFRAARGEFITILNHDDWLAPGFAEQLVEGLRLNPEAVLAFCDHWVIDAQGRRLEPETDRNSRAWGRASLSAGLHRPFVSLVAAQSIPMAMGALFRRAALPADLPPHAGPAYDLWLTYLLCRDGAGAWYVPDRLSAWRAHDGNLTSAGGIDWLRGAASCWQAMARDEQCRAVRPHARRMAALGHYACAVRSWRAGQRTDCARFAVRSLAQCVTMRGLAALLLPLLPPRGASAPRLQR